MGLILTDLTHKLRCNQRSGCIELTVPHLNLRFCTNFRLADLAMICLVHDVFASSVSLFASEFSTGHHAFDDIPIRKAGLTSGVSKNKRLKGSIQGLVEDVQGAESSHLTTFPPGCQHHGNHFFDLSLSDFVVYGLSLVKFASDISGYSWDLILFDPLYACRSFWQCRKPSRQHRVTLKSHHQIVDILKGCDTNTDNESFLSQAPGNQRSAEDAEDSAGAEDTSRLFLAA